MAAVAEEKIAVGDAPYEPPASPPIIVFMNSASGGRMGPKVLERIRTLIPNSRLFDLDEVHQKKWIPEDKLKEFQHVAGVKVLICGGDGTMGWILSCIDRLRMSAEASSSRGAGSPSSQDTIFPVAMMPLGTGNDLARSFGWGPGFSRGMLKPKFLDKVKEAPSSKLDRWLLSVMPYEPLGDDEKIKATKLPPTFSYHKYASAIGNLQGQASLGLLSDTSEHGPTQSVLRIGKSFSVKMSSLAKLVHEQEMSRSSSNGRSSLTGSRHSLRSDGLTEEQFATGPPGMTRALSAPPNLRAGSGKSKQPGAHGSSKFAMPPLGEIEGGVDVSGASEPDGANGTSGDAEVSSAAPVATGSAGGGESTAAAAAAAAAAARASGEGEEDGEEKDTKETERRPASSSVGATADSLARAEAKKLTAALPDAIDRFQPALVKADGARPGAGLVGTSVEMIAQGAEGGLVMPLDSRKPSSSERAAPPNDAPSPSSLVTSDEGFGGDGVASGGGGGAVARGLGTGETKVEMDEEKDEAWEARNRRGQMGPQRAMPSISVIQRFDTWESYDAVFCNYFSFGVDAVAASAFHDHRQAYPQLFTSRFRNQVWYARKGFPAAGGFPCGGDDPPPPVKEYLELKIKRSPGGEWEPVELDPSLRGVVVLNLQSYGGGRNLWGSATGGCSQTQYAKAAPDDELLEIVGITNIFKLGCIMGCNNVGARAHRLCQAAEVELRIRKPIHMQIDGEPWHQAPAKVNIQHYGQSTCLRGNK